jgi:hypothetical protein
VRKVNKHIKEFKTFEVKDLTWIKSHGFISMEDIGEIFVEMTDKGFKMVNHFDYPKSKDIYTGKYFFEFKKSLSREYLGYISKGGSYGFTNLEAIKKEFNVLDILDDCKYRLNSMEYTIGFEFEFNLSSMTKDSIYMNIICHMRHSKFDKEDETQT